MLTVCIQKKKMHIIDVDLKFISLNFMKGKKIQQVLIHKEVEIILLSLLNVNEDGGEGCSDYIDGIEY